MEKMITHSFSKILEGRSQQSLALTTAQAALEQLTNNFEEVKKSKGEDAAKTILEYPYARRALSQCIEYLQGNKGISDEDFYVYYQFSCFTLKKAEMALKLDQV